MRPPGSNRTPGSGRKKGTPNRRTLLVEEIMGKANFEPIERLILIAEGKWKELGCKKAPPMKLALELQFYALRELAQYKHPKRKAIEVKAEVETKARVLVVPQRAASVEAWSQRAAVSRPEEA
jgi:hypothetical protein